MRADALGEALGAPVARAQKLAGGASKEAWAVDTEDGRRLLVRRAGGGVIHRDTLSLREEFEVLVAAREAGVAVPEPLAYLGEVEGREAFAMERVEGETIGRRIVRDPPAALPVQLAEQLARIHGIPRDRLPFLPRGDLWERLYSELDSVEEPHPAIEYGLAWCRERLPLEREDVVSHGDFRIGNVAVGPDGLVAVLDWEFAHVGDPAEDLAWPLVRAWRFGADDSRLGGVGEVEPYAARYAELTGLEVPTRRALRVGGARQLQVGDRSAHPVATPPARRGAERRARDPRQARRRDGVRAARPHRAGVVSDRPSAGELAAAVREFLEAEILPTLDDHRLRFRTLVAMNALSIVERESPPPAAPRADDRELAARLRRGEVRPDDLVFLKHKVADKLRVASPRYLDRY